MEAVVCGSCGAKVRAGRPRCLRCGAVLVAVVADEPQRAAQRWMIAAAAIACVALGAFGVAVSRPRPADMPAPPVSAPPAQTTVSRPRGDAVAAVLEPAGAFAARDASAVGAIAYGRGDVASAVGQFEKAVAADPRDPAALNNLGQALVRAGRVRDALPYFDRAIAVADGTWAYQFNRARAYAELHEYQQAIAGYRRAAELFPGDYATQFNLAKALQASGDVPSAVTAFERAIALAPGQPDFQLAYGKALEAGGRPADAAAAYRKYLAAEPGSAEREHITAHLAELEKP